MADGDRGDPPTGAAPLDERLAAVVVERSQLVIAVLLVSSLLVGSGVLFLEVETGFIEVGDLPEREAQEYVEANFTDDRGSGSVLVLVEGDDVISQDAARQQIAAEQRFLADERVRTNPDDPPIAFANAVAALVTWQIDSGDDNVSDEAVAHRREMLEQGNLTYGPGEMTHPPLERQASILERLSEDNYDSARRTVLQGGGDAFLGVDYEAGPANATIVVVPMDEPGPDPASHAAVQEIADEELEGDTRAFSGALHTIELEQAIGDSLLLVGPLGFLFVLSVLWVAYRDPVDIALGGLGIAVVLLWMFGFLGWSGLGFNQVFVAAPILVIGLSVDYMFHVVMRYREHTDEAAADGADSGSVERVRTAMTVALAGVGTALAIVSATTILGFLSNLTSPVPTVREFGVVGAFSILSIFVVFAVLLPAARVEIDRRLAARGSLDVRPAIGRGDRLGSLLVVPARVAWNAPWVVLAVALVVGVVSAYTATLLSPTVSLSVLPADPHPWLYALPEPLSPGTYHFQETADALRSVFGHGGREGEVLVRGDVASTAALERVARGSGRAHDSAILAEGSPEEPAVRSPLTAMAATAAENDSFNRTLQAADTDGDGIPDRNVAAVYDELYRVAPQHAGRFVHREDGQYRALLIRVSVRTGIENQQMASELDAVAAAIEGGGDGEVGARGNGDGEEGSRGNGDGVTAMPASQANVMVAGIQAIVDGIVVGIATALFVVTALVTAVFRFRHGSAALGLVTAAPVTLAVAWLFGTMYVLGIQLNEVTGLIATFTIALGVDYTIHVSERFRAELRDGERSAERAVVRTLQGTGGALFGSALTTGGAFALLLLAVFPPLQLFGAMMALTMLYAFVASVVVLPALLALWSGRGGG